MHSQVQHNLVKTKESYSCNAIISLFLNCLELCQVHLPRQVFHRIFQNL